MGTKRLIPYSDICILRGQKWYLDGIKMRVEKDT